MMIEAWHGLARYARELLKGACQVDRLESLGLKLRRKSNCCMPPCSERSKHSTIGFHCNGVTFSIHIALPSAPCYVAEGPSEAYLWPVRGMFSLGSLSCTQGIYSLSHHKRQRWTKGNVYVKLGTFVQYAGRGGIKPNSSCE
jgi:hypothetical protein